MRLLRTVRGAVVELSGDEVATAIDAYLVARSVYVGGPRTVTVNGELCREGRVFVDPSGSAHFNDETKRHSA